MLEKTSSWIIGSFCPFAELATAGRMAHMRQNSQKLLIPSNCQKSFKEEKNTFSTYQFHMHQFVKYFPKLVIPNNDEMII